MDFSAAERLRSTDRKRIEEALRGSETKYRSMMEAMTDLVYICSPEFTVEYMNPAMIKRTGRDAVGEKCYSALNNLSTKCDWCVFDKITAGETLETYIVSPKDNRNYRVTNIPIKNKDGSVSKLTIFRDITDYLIAVKEKEKAQAQFQQTQKMESIGNLAGGIAHDFNNILYPIIGMSELLLEDLVPESDQHENAQVILEAGKRGADLVKQILAFSRQDEHRILPVRVQKVLKEVLKLSRSTIPTDIEIIQDISGDCGLVMADSTQLHQIAMNLITNAYHAMEPASGTLSVKLKEIALEPDDVGYNSLKPGQYAILTVSDTGCGIEPSVMAKIFEPYFTTKAKGKGTGLGLAVVYGIVKEYNGDIKVYSEAGKGTTVNVYLPLIEKPSDTVSGEMAKDLQTGTEHILLVDDEEPIARLQRKMLERLGYQVTVRLNSVEALEAFRAKPVTFDLVITDMTMPTMTGDHLARELIAIRADIPVIICTGFSERINKEESLAGGIKGFLMKPVIKSQMAQMVRRVLDEATALSHDE